MEGSSQGGKGGFDFIKIDGLAKAIGTSEPGLRFLISLLIGYPLSLVYHAIVSRGSPYFKNAYFSICGLLILYFGFGQDFVYPIISVLVTYVILTLIGGTRLSVLILFTFNLTYLIVGYIFTASDSYDIKWTTPQCILCLRLIGLTWDCYDGKRPKEELSADQKLTALDRIPTLMEITGFSFYFGAQMAGPQFSMRRYVSFIEGTLIDENAEAKGGSRLLAGFMRFLLGVVFLVLFITLDPLYPTQYVMSKKFLDASFIRKCFELAIWYHVMFLKYIFVWLFSEGCCIFTGLGYNGVDSNGKAKWDGLRNIRLTQYYITGYTLESLVGCFNINTNQWVAKYVFKRLRFLGNKNISHVTALAFLAIWHGFYIGYFLTFAREFIIIIVQRLPACFAGAISLLAFVVVIFMAHENDDNKDQLRGDTCKLNDRIYQLTGLVFDELSPVTKGVLIPFMYVSKHVMFGYSVVPFALLRWRRTKVVYSSMYFIGTIVTVVALLVIFVIGLVVKSRKKADKESIKKKTY